MNLKCAGCAGRGWYNEYDRRGIIANRRRCFKCKGSGYVRVLPGMLERVSTHVPTDRRCADLTDSGVMK